MNKIAQQAEELLTPVIESMGYWVVEVSYVNKAGDNRLTIYIDSQSGVSLDDCEKVSNTVSDILDNNDITDNAPYSLDISSAGLDRPIKSDRDYFRNIGREVECKLYAPLTKGSKSKIIEGVLVNKDANTVTIETFDNQTIQLDVKQIALLTQLIKF